MVTVNPREAHPLRVKIEIHPPILSLFQLIFLATNGC